MLEDPGLDPEPLASSVRLEYGIDAAALRFVPGYDAHAATYRVDTRDGSYFLKVRFDAVDEVALDVPASLIDAGVPNILAPIRSRASAALWTGVENGALVLYPFVAGRNAMDAGMTGDQWRTFGVTLRAVHDSGLERRFSGRLVTDTFSSVPRTEVERTLQLAKQGTFGSKAATRFAALVNDHAGRIESMVERSEEIGAGLRRRSPDRVLCHADIHAANILVADDDGILLVDWDGPMIAPRERDLLFVIGSRIARDVGPHEEAWFFEGYGDVSIDREAIVYYRYERVLQDIAEFAASILLDEAQEEDTRDAQSRLVARFFAPGGILETIEQVGGSTPADA